MQVMGLDGKDCDTGQQEQRRQRDQGHHEEGGEAQAKWQRVQPELLQATVTAQQQLVFGAGRDAVEEHTGIESLADAPAVHRDDLVAPPEQAFGGGVRPHLRDPSDVALPVGHPAGCTGAP